jgi:hypothetical protein
LNKKREALRRGLRSFIEDTSRELADLEGRAPSDDAAGEPLPVAPASAAEPPAPPGGGPIPAAKPPEAPSQVAPDRAHPGPAPSPGIRSEAGSPVEAAPEPLTSGGAAERPAILTAAPASDAPRPTTEEARPAEHPTKTTSPPDEHPAKVPGRPQASRRRRRPQPGAKAGANGVRADQAQARKGVCFAYFLNHECWRVPEAYCNSALQVCITRECPVYHLHKEAFEHRFARKFKHFW